MAKIEKSNSTFFWNSKIQLLSEFKGPSLKNLGGVAKQSYGPFCSLLFFIYYILPSDEGYISGTGYVLGNFWLLGPLLGPILTI